MSVHVNTKVGSIHTKGKNVVVNTIKCDNGTTLIKSNVPISIDGQPPGEAYEIYIDKITHLEAHEGSSIGSNNITVDASSLKPGELKDLVKKWSDKY